MKFSDIPPTNGLNDDSINGVLSNSLLKLQFEDRNSIKEEVHGVSCLAPSERAPDFLSNALFRLRQELSTICNNDGTTTVPVPPGTTAGSLSSSNSNMHHPSPLVSSASASPHQYYAAYKHAVQLGDKSYINTDDFHVLFLRSELFDIKKAADRLLVYLDFGVMLFGHQLLTQRLALSMLDDDGLKAIKDGNLQLLPFRDRAGRRVLISLPGMCNYSSLLRCKLWFYFSWVAAEDDDETQQKGIVSIVYGPRNEDDTITNYTNKDKKKKELSLRQKMHDIPKQQRITSPNGRGMMSGLPIRVVALHFCYPDTVLCRLFKAVHLYILGEDLRARTIWHQGTTIEMQYSIMTYGIPIEHIPCTDTGVVKKKYLNQWYNIRQYLEALPYANNTKYSSSSLSNSTNSNLSSLSSSSSSSSQPQQQVSIVECPGSKDVLFRRAGSCSAHPGNVHFNNLVETKKELHSQCKTNDAKYRLIWSIVEEIESQGGRFYVWDMKKCWWAIMNDRKEIRSKVAVFLRDFRRHHRGLTKSTNKTNTNTNTNKHKLQVMQSDTTVFESQDGTTNLQTRRKRMRCYSFGNIEPIPINTFIDTGSSTTTDTTTNTMDEFDYLQNHPMDVLKCDEFHDHIMNI